MKLLYKSTSVSSYNVATTLSKFFDELPEGGRFYCNIARANPPAAYLSRAGVWSDPWDTVVPLGWEMPTFDLKFNLSFEEVTDRRALDIKNIIDQTGKNCVVFYSGGIDSTVVMASLIKNLNQEHLDKVIISMSADSIIENPYFYTNHIEGKFKIIDSSKNFYSDLVKNKENFCISADLGDFIYGTELGVKMYPQMKYLEETMQTAGRKNLSHLYNKISDSNTHYSEYRDILIYYFNTALKRGISSLKTLSYIPQNLSSENAHDANFGHLFYEKIHNNIKSVNVPIHSLHDFFWWSMFNPRFVWGAIRPAMIYGLDTNLKSTLSEDIVSWFGSLDYQQWSMHNNNNGEKLKGITQSTYKWASKCYLHNFDKNDFYFVNKMKMPSMPVIVSRAYKQNFKNMDSKWALDENYQVIKMDQPGIKSYFETGLKNYKVDWV